MSSATDPARQNLGSWSLWSPSGLEKADPGGMAFYDKNLEPTFRTFSLVLGTR